MTLNIDLKAIKKATGQPTTVEFLEMFPTEKPQHKESLEEGTLKLRLPDLSIELRNVMYRIRPDKHLVITIPFRKQGKKKGKFKIVNRFIFTDQSVWQGILEELRKQVLENYEERQPTSSNERKL